MAVEHTWRGELHPREQFDTALLSEDARLGAQREPLREEVNLLPQRHALDHRHILHHALRPQPQPARRVVLVVRGHSAKGLGKLPYLLARTQHAQRLDALGIARAHRLHRRGGCGTRAQLLLQSENVRVEWRGVHGRIEGA